MKKTEKIVLTGLLAAIVFVLQMLGTVIHLGTFAPAMPFLPIIVGAALCGTWAGAALGLTFGLAVLLSGDANLFIVIEPVSSVAIVMLKGLLAGLAAGYTYKLMEKINSIAAVMVAAIACQLANTGTFILGCYLFFAEEITKFSFVQDILGENPSAMKAIIVVFVAPSFFLTMGFNLVLAPTVSQIIKIGYKTFRKKIA